MFKLVTKKKKKQHGRIASLANSKINSIEGLTSKVVTEPVINHDEFVLRSIVLKWYDEMKEKIKTLKT